MKTLANKQMLPRKPSRWLVKGIVFGSLLLILIIASVITGLALTAHSNNTATAATIGSPEDPHIKFVGRWDTSNPALYHSAWPGAYFETGFTGTTVKVHLAGFSAIYVSIDHGPDKRYSYLGPKGLLNLTPTPLKSGTHRLRVAVANDSDTLFFKGLTLDTGATTVDPHPSTKLIEFVGDSITVGALTTSYALSDYAWLTAERLGVQHTQIAEGGMCLVDNWQCYVTPPIGMSRQYFKNQPTYFPNSPDWNFAHYQATAVVINLGTNDQGYHASNSAYQATYISFVRKIHVKYPHALIFALEPFNGAEAPYIQAAVQELQTSGDHYVSYISTAGWLQPGSNDYTYDGVHPTDQGQQKAAAHLTPILADALGIKI